VIGAAGTVPCFALWGDSHAKALTIGVGGVAERFGVSGYDITHTGVPPFPETVDDGYNNRVLEFIKANKNIQFVILASQWGGVVNPAIKLTVKRLRSIGVMVFVVADVPQLKQDPVRISLLNTLMGFSYSYDPVKITFADYNASGKGLLNALNQFVRDDKVVLLDLGPYLFDSSNQSIVEVNNKVLYIDDDHLSSAGSAFVSPVFHPVFSLFANRGAM